MIVALIVAAGSGERLRAGRPKALIELAGRPLVQWSIDALQAVAAVEQIVVALPPATSAPIGVTAVEGGATRSQSVRRALSAAAAPARAGAAELVLVQDAARPLLTPRLAERVIAALQRDGDADAAIAVGPVTDTIKRATDSGTVTATLDRSELWAVQTPQVFRRTALEQALSAPDAELASATDDASLIERGGGRVIVVSSEQDNLKVTTPLDLRIAELLLRERSSPAGAINPA